MNDNLFVSAKVVCKRRNISRTALHEGVKRGDIPPPYHFGRSARWSVAELEDNERAIAEARFARKAVR